MTGPYAQAAGDYWNAGWTGVIPLPARRKDPPPDGYTGWEGRYPSYADVWAWVEDRGEGNVALHLPPGVIGLDIDDYGTKRGAESLASGERLWGPLPPTWRTTSRDDGVSAIRFYRVPSHEDGRSLRWPGGFGPGTETIHRGHRYAVAPPSIHPDTGRPYRWFNPDGAVSLTPPRIDDLPWLPTSWVVGLTENRPAATYQGAGMDDETIREWLHAHNHGQPCTPMADAVDDALEQMRGGAHESLRYLMRIVGLAASGHDGLHAGLATVRTAFIAEVAPRRGGEQVAAGEWTRSLFGAVDKIVGEMARTGAKTSKIDPCDTFTGSWDDLVNEVYKEKAAELDAMVSPAPMTTAEASADHILTQTTPGSAEHVSGSDAGDDSLDNDAESSDEPAGEGGDTPEQKRARDVERAYQELVIREEAKRRLAAENAPQLEWLDSDAFLDGPEPEPLVPNMLYKDSLARIYGKAGCGKSFVVLDLAYSLATGTPWSGHELERTRVAYVMAEGQRVNTRRGKAWLDRRQVDRAELRGWFYAVPHKVLLVEEGVRDLVAKVREHKIGLVILDTKNAMMVGDENSATDINTMRMAMDAIREATDACVLLVDHTGLADGTRARGSSAGEGAVETEIRVENDGQSPAKVTVTMTRDKDGEPGTQWEFMLRMHPIDEKKPPAVLVPVDDTTELPTRMTSSEAETAWLDYDGPIPVEVLHYDGGEAVTRALPDLTRFMAHDAGVADPNRIGVGQADAVRALSEKELGQGRGHSRGTVRRAWSVLRDLGYIVPVEADRADDPEKVAKAMEEKTTGRHVWSRR